MSALMLLLATLKLVLPAGTASVPSAVVPPTPTSPAMSFWWDDVGLCAGERRWMWKDLMATPTNGASFKFDFGTIDRLSVPVEVTLDLAAPRILMGSFGVIGGAAVSNDIRLVAAKDGSFSVDFSAQGATPDYMRIVKSLKLASGQEGAMSIVGVGSSSGMASVSLRDGAGRVLYASEGPYRRPGLLFDNRYLWTDTKMQVVHLIADSWQDESDDYRLKVTAYDLMTDSVPGWTRTLTLSRVWGVQDIMFSIVDLPAGFHKLHFDYLDPNGAVVHSDTSRYFKPDGKAPWDDTMLGAEDSVPPPWTQPVFEKDRFVCWNREVMFGGEGLLRSIVSSGQELLTEPVTILVDGHPLAFEVFGCDAKSSEATYRLRSVTGGVEARIRCEFDGYLHIDLDYPETLASLAWQVSVDRSKVAAFDDCSSDLAKDMLAGGKCFERTFSFVEKPWWWISGPVGLMGGMLTPKGTHVRDLAKSGHVKADARTVTVVTRLVDDPIGGKSRRTASFYLQATPVKPKDLSFSSLSQDKLRLWTGYMCQYYEIKYPGFENPVQFDRFRKELDDGIRVFYYNSTKGASPESPFWGWYGMDWNRSGIDYFAHEVPLYGERRKTNNWCYGCPNSKSFLESKIWGVNWLLNEAEPKSKDLYFDLADASCICRNPTHGCVWKDDFGRTHLGNSTETTREIHKRCYRLVKAKNPDGVLYGHFNRQRTPSDVFFDLICSGEPLAWAMFKNGGTYYDVFTPEMMQTTWMPKGREMTMTIGSQFRRSLQCYAGVAAMRAWDPNTPENRRAVRHFAAYVKIHDLIIECDRQRDGGIYYKLEQAVCALGPNRTYSSYCSGKPVVVLSNPGPRQLWARFSTPEKNVLVILNDTDEMVEQVVSIKDVRSVGHEIVDGTQFDFSSGSCTFSLGPREAKFVGFDKRDGDCSLAGSWAE